MCVRRKQGGEEGEAGPSSFSTYTFTRFTCMHIGIHAYIYIYIYRDILVRRKQGGEEG